MFGEKPQDVEKDDTVYTIEDFNRNVKSSEFIDYDGFGQYVKDNKKYGQVFPSKWNLEDCKANGVTHIIWYNR